MIKLNNFGAFSCLVKYTLYICIVFHQQAQQTMQTPVEIPQIEVTLSFQRYTHNQPVVKFNNEPEKAPLLRFSQLHNTERPYLVITEFKTWGGNDVTYIAEGYPTLDDARLGTWLWEGVAGYTVIGIADSGTVPAEAGELITVYYRASMMGSIVKQEGKLLKVGRQQYAQYPNAPYLEYVPKRKRNGLRLFQSFQPYMLVLKGHGHPDPTELFGINLGSFQPGVAVKTTSYASFSSGWVTDFEAKINPYLASQPKNIVIADFREWLGND
jgi:hypothetical protein